MVLSTFTFPSRFDDVAIHACKWGGNTVGKPKGVIQIAHGMAEHIERYSDFAHFLVEHGFVVYGNDHRGHGKTIRNSEEYGFFAEENGFEKAVDDVKELSLIIKKEYPDVPIILLGHSMGSFIARRYIQLYDDLLFAVILSGTGGDPGLVGKIGVFLARMEIKKNGKQKPSPFLHKLVFGSYNRSFQPEKTEFDWLSSSEEVVEKYIGDPLCGEVCSAGFFLDLFEGLQLIHKRENVMKTRKDLPIYLFSGDKDPVGGKNGKGVLDVYEKYKEIGMEDVTCKLYQDGRHEMLNEVNKKEVYQDVLQWINQRLGL